MHARKILQLFVVLSLTTFFSLSASTASNKGKFLTNLDLRVISIRDRKLLKEFRYSDPEGTIWIVPKGSVVNGASIPKPLWSILGGPWSGSHNKAAVIHDYFYDRQKYGSDAIHRVFYDAMITAGTPQYKAKLMYYAVVRFNPHWERLVDDPYSCMEHQAKERLRLNNQTNCLPELFGEAGSGGPGGPRYALDEVNFGSAGRAEILKASEFIRTKTPSVEQLKVLAKIRRKKAK